MPLPASWCWRLSTFCSRSSGSRDSPALGRGSKSSPPFAPSLQAALQNLGPLKLKQPNWVILETENEKISFSFEKMRKKPPKKPNWPTQTGGAQPGNHWDVAAGSGSGSRPPKQAPGEELELPQPSSSASLTARAWPWQGTASAAVAALPAGSSPMPPGTPSVALPEAGAADPAWRKTPSGAFAGATAPAAAGFKTSHNFCWW